MLIQSIWTDRRIAEGAGTMGTSLLRMSVVAGLGTMLFVASAMAQVPSVDGLFDEWSDDTQIAADPAGDAAGAFDVTEVHALSRGSVLFVHFDTTTLLNIQSGPAEEGTLRLELLLPGLQQLTIDFRTRLAYLDGNPNDGVAWPDLNYVSMTTYAADRFELRLDLSLFGVDVGDSIEIDFSGSDELDEPAEFSFTQPADELVIRSPQQESCTTFRIASLNTLFGGLLNPSQAPAIGRLVQAAAADIYCFQEQNSPADDIADRLEELDPLQNGAPWSVEVSSDTVIASQQLTLPIPHDGDVAAIVDFGSDGAVGVFSIHPSCCGYIGNGQDLGRIAEMQAIVATIEDLRDGAFGPELEPYRYVPIIIIGDWNLVGSRTPLDLVEDPDGPNHTHWLLRHLVDSDVFTWRRLNTSPGGFSPGLLDLLTYSTGLLHARNGFVLDSGTLTQDLLDELQLDPADSAASDHFMLVGDFATLANGDLDGDGDTDAADLAQLLGSWGQCPLCPADLSGDGVIDATDLAFLLGNWGPCE